MNIKNSDLRRDFYGRYLLEDIYKIAVNGGRQQAMTPISFLSIPAMRSYEMKVSKETGRKAIVEGIYGNYAEEILALKYANHIDHSFEIALSLAFKENNQEPAMMKEVPDPVAEKVIHSSDISELRMRTILSAIQAANDILVNTPGIDPMSAAECSIRLLEVNLAVDMSPAMALFTKKPVKVPEVDPTPALKGLVEKETTESPKKKHVRSSVIKKTGTLKGLEGHPYVMSAADLGNALEISSSEVNTILDEMGLQVKITNGQRRPTSKTGEVGRMVNIGENGKNNPRLLWHTEMVAVLKDHISRTKPAT